MRYRVVVAREAREQAHRLDARWRLRARVPDVFWNEFSEALRRLAHPPIPGVLMQRLGVRNLRRILLQKSKVHLYFAVDDDEAVVRVWALGGAMRRRRPSMPKPAHD